MIEQDNVEKGLQKSVGSSQCGSDLVLTGRAMPAWEPCLEQTIVTAPHAIGSVRSVGD